MAIQVEHEDNEALRKWDLGLESVMERCYFCCTRTRYWYTPKNEPCCEACAAVKSPEDFKE